MTILFGNIQAFRNLVFPVSEELFGSRSSTSLSKHKQYVQEMLKLLSLHGSMTTWDLAKNSIILDLDSMRSRDKVFRRLLLGRTDRGKSSPGVLDIGLVTSTNSVSMPSNKYRLSAHGLLYCLAVLDLSNDEIDRIVSNYSDIFPKIFGKWHLINSYFKNSIDLLKEIGNAHVYENRHLVKFTDFPFVEINDYIHTKYVDFYESISESDFADAVSYWFFTNLPIVYLLSGKNTNELLENWMCLFEEDLDLKHWYYSFLLEMKNFYLVRFDRLDHQLSLDNNLIEG